MAYPIGREKGRAEKERRKESEEEYDVDNGQKREK